MPFSVDAFFAVFGAYNAAIWPLQIVAYLAGLVVLAMVFRPSAAADRVILLILAAMWLVNGVGYHLLHFASINPAARVFAALFVLEAVLLGAAAFRSRDRVVFDAERGPRSWLAAALILFAMLLYPALGFLFDHRYPEVPMFGVAPCPTTVFTIGVLLALVASVDVASEHPVAEAIVDAARARGLDLAAVEDFEAIAGHGVHGRVRGHTVLVGNRAHMRRAAVTTTPLDADADRAAREGQTPVEADENGKDREFRSVDAAA